MGRWVSFEAARAFRGFPSLPRGKDGLRENRKEEEKTADFLSAGVPLGPNKRRLCAWVLREKEKTCWCVPGI